jgi:hypothetical protein
MKSCYNITVMTKHFNSVSKNLSNHPFYRQTMILLFLKFILVDITCLIAGLCCLYLKANDWGAGAPGSTSLETIHAVGYILLTFAIVSILLNAVLVLGYLVICGCGNSLKDSKKNSKKGK